jgi:hypothetical protein
MKIGDIIKAALVKGDDTKTILEAVKKAHPDAQTTPASIAWYRSKMRKDAKKDEPAKKAPAQKAPTKKHTLTEVPVAEALKNARPYCVKGIKKTTGMEGHGFITSLYRDGVKVAEVADYGDGGRVHFDWLDYNLPKVEAKQYNNYKDEEEVTGTWMVSPEQKRFMDFVRALPKEVNPWDETQTPHYVDADSYISDLVNDVELAKQFRRLTSKRIAFIALDGKLYTYSLAPTPEAIAKFKAKNEPGVIILNELSEEEGVNALRKGQSF